MRIPQGVQGWGTGQGQVGLECCRRLCPVLGWQAGRTSTVLPSPRAPRYCSWWLLSDPPNPSLCSTLGA